MEAEFAFYVNKNGWRSRPKWAIVWEGVPTSFGKVLSYSAVADELTKNSIAIPICHRV